MMMDTSLMDAFLSTTVQTIDKEKISLNDLSQTIWHLKELSFQEKESHSALCQFLEIRGFNVERSITGLETAFVAQWETMDKGDADPNAVRKPHVAVICEYDALPNIGHACGHNLIAEIGVSAALGIKASLEKNGKIAGKLSVIGTPAEEGGGGKIEMLKLGIFDDIDVALMAHPAPFTDARPIFLSTRRFSANFQGKPSHAAGFPWEGVNALDAAVQAYVSIGTLRQQLKPEWRAGVIITKGGEKTNIIPSQTEIQCQTRTRKESEIVGLENKLKRCVTAAADATGCTVEITDGTNPYKSLITNEALAQIYEASLTSLGVQVSIPKSKIVLGSTDMGDVSHQVPSLHPCYNCNTSTFNHTLEFAQAAGSPDAQEPTLIEGKALALTALKVFSDEASRTRIKAFFKEDMEEA